MKLKIEIDLSNAAFQDGNEAAISDILVKYSEKFAKCIKFLGPDTSAPVFDLNGSAVGSWKLEK